MKSILLFVLAIFFVSVASAQNNQGSETQYINWLGNYRFMNGLKVPLSAGVPSNPTGYKLGSTKGMLGYDTTTSTLLVNNGTGFADASANKAKSYPTINAQTGTAYTVQVSDNGNVIKCTNSGAITVTIPAGLGVGFGCVIIQGGTGVITIVGSGSTLHGTLTTSGQYSAKSLLPFSSNEYTYQ